MRSIAELIYLGGVVVSVFVSVVVDLLIEPSDFFAFFIFFLFLLTFPPFGVIVSDFVSVFVVLSDPCAKAPVAASAKAANNAAIVRNMGFSFVGR